MEEREGFEPSKRSRACQFSRLVPSTTRPPLLGAMFLTGVALCFKHLLALPGLNVNIASLANMPYALRINFEWIKLDFEGIFYAEF